MIKYEGKYLNVKYENDWEFVERANITGIVGILAITNDHNIVLVEQYREPVKKVCVEIPAGIIGDHDKSESLLNGTQRELLEETGYKAKNLFILGEFPLSPGITNEVMTLVLATDLTKAGEGKGDEAEDITVVEIPLMTAPQEIMKLSNNGEKYIDCKVFLAAYFAYQEVVRMLKSQEIKPETIVKQI